MQYHVKCSGLTRDALQAQRDNGPTCRAPEAPPTESEHTNERISELPTVAQKELKLVQWNCDGINASMDELAELMRREGVHVVVLQESKLCNRDETPRIVGFTAVRKDRGGGGGTAPTRGGGLCTYVRDDVPYWEKTLCTRRGVKKQQIVVPTSRDRRINIINLYVPPVRGEAAAGQWEEAMDQLRYLNISNDTLWCGNFNAHHEVRDPLKQADGRGEEMVDLMAEGLMATLNDGSPTRYDRQDKLNAAGRSTTDVSMVPMEEWERMSWRTLEDLSSDHVPILISWNREIRVGRSWRPSRGRSPGGYLGW